MAVYKCTWSFEGVQPQRGRTQSSAEEWSETWYRDMGEIGIDEAVRLASNRTDPGAYIFRRRGCLAQNYRMTTVRVSNVAIPRLSKEALIGVYGLPPGANGGPPADFSVATASAPVETAILIDFVAPSGLLLGGRNHHRRFALRGLPRSLLNGNVLNEGGEVWPNLINFLDTIGVAQTPVPIPKIGQTSPWSIRVNTGDSGLTWENIRSLTVDAVNDRQIIVGTPGLAPSTGGQVLLRRVKFPLRMNRTWNILNGTGPGGANPGMMVLGTHPHRIAGDWDGTGQYQVVSPRFPRITQYTIVGKRNRQTAGPLHRIRGRQRAE